MEIFFSKAKEAIDFKKPVYECSVCGCIFNWNKQSAWYGSYKDLEEHPEKIKHFCSEDCKKQINRLII
jgi:hypothetical protein